MASRATLAIKIIADATAAARDMDKFAQQTGKSSKAMERAAGASKAVIGGLLAVGGVSAKAASDLEQSVGAVESVFGTASSKVNELAKAAANSVGLAQAEYNDLASVLGAQLKNLGIEQDKLVGTTDNLVTLGADLAATFGGSTSDAVAALSSLMRGETDPIERYGVSIKAADVAARLAAEGQDKLTGKAKVQAETQAKLALVLEQTTGAQGAFAREADTAAGQQARATAAAKNAAAQFGAVLLPILTKVAAMLARVASFAAQHPRLFQAIATALGVAAVSILAYNAATKAAAIATGIFNAVLAANPITLVVIAIAALVAGLILAYNKCETFRRIVDTAFGAVTTAATNLIEFFRSNWKNVLLVLLTGPFGAAVLLIRKHQDKIVGVVTALPGQARKALSSLGGTLRGVFTGAMNSALGAVTGIGGTIVNAIARIPGRMLALGSRFARAGRDILQQFIDGMKNAAGIITGIAGNVWDAVRGLLNGAIDKINSALNFEISLPGPNLHVNAGKIPRLATGGRATGGSLVIIGEGREPETVLPDSLLRGLLERANAAGTKTVSIDNRTYLQIDVDGSGVVDENKIAQQIATILARWSARLGRPVTDLIGAAW